VVPSTNHGGLPAVLCKGVESKKIIFFLHVTFLFPPVPLPATPLSLDFDLEMSDSFYLMWKKNTEINYLIFFNAVNRVVCLLCGFHFKTKSPLESQSDV